MKYFNFNKYTFLITLLVGGLMVACNTEEKPPSAAENATTSAVPRVEKAKVLKKSAEYTLQLPGELAPYEEVKLYPKAKGFVQKLYVDRGSEVVKGQLLAKLEAAEISQQYIAASSRQREVLEGLKYSLQNYLRLQEASKSTGAVAPIELEQAKARLMSDSATYLSMKAEMAAAAQLLDYLEIRAPFSGIITQRNISQGTLVGTGNEQPLFTLAQRDRLRLTIAIPEKHARSVSDSTVVKFRLSNHPDETFTAQLSRSSGVLDKALRSMLIEFDVHNKEGKLNGGEYVEAEVYLRRPTESLWVPSSSLINISSGLFVQKIENDKVQRVNVKEGIRQGELVEVFGPLQEQDLVVLNGNEELRDGSPVQL